jgi:hypothetical protein
VFHEHVFEMLRPGGAAIHIFPTLYAMPFVLNRMLSPGSSAAVLFRLFPARIKKFPAYYSWCRGPTKRQLRRIQSIGFTIERYVGAFGHNLYRHVAPLDLAHRALSRWLVKHPRPDLTSIALVVVRRPE